MRKYFLVCLLLFFLFPFSVKALVYYDSSKSYSFDSSEIQSAISEMQQEQSVQNVSSKGNKLVDIVIFAGQSNMVGKDNSGRNTISSITNSGFEMRFNSKQQAVGIKYLSNSTDLKTSLIPAFANAYYNNTGVPIIAVQTAVSGSKISSWQKNGKNYKNAIAKMKSTISYVESHPENFNLRNIYFVWYQGESDTPNLTYENNLQKLFQNTKEAGVDQNFLIRIGHLYHATDTSNDNLEKQKFNRYTNMIKLQTEFTRKNDLAILVSTKAALLSLEKNPSVAADGSLNQISDMMIDQVHFSQMALNIIGSEAGKNAASYVNTGTPPMIKDVEYANGSYDFYYTGYDSSLSFTEEQKDFFYDKSREFVREGNQSGLLQYGILSKYKAYQLQTVYYPSYKYNGTTIMYMGKNNKKDFKKGNYLGFDCSGFVSFIYHYVFGLPFDYARIVDGQVVNHNPWSTSQYLSQPQSPKYGTNYFINTFKYVGELKSTKKKYTLYSAKQKFKLSTGDLIIGKNSDTDAHIVIYIGKVKKNKKDLVLNSTSVAEHNIKVDGKRYHTDYAYLTKDNFDNAKNFSHTYKNITVLRLNNGIMPDNFIGNDYTVDFSKLNNNIPAYQFIPKYIDNTVVSNDLSWTMHY